MEYKLSSFEKDALISKTGKAWELTLLIHFLLRKMRLILAGQW